MFVRIIKEWYGVVAGRFPDDNSSFVNCSLGQAFANRLNICPWPTISIALYPATKVGRRPLLIKSASTGKISFPPDG